MTSFPKPETLAKLRKIKRRLKADQAKAFREAVWNDASLFGVGRATCAHCGFILARPGSLYKSERAGHVHHLRGRRVAPEDVYDPSKAVLLCSVCHRGIHDGTLKLKTGAVIL